MTTPDPTAVAAVIDGLEEALFFAIREHVERQHLAEYLQPDDMAMHPPSEESVAAWNSVAGEIVRHLAAQAAKADKELVDRFDYAVQTWMCARHENNQHRQPDTAENLKEAEGWKENSRIALLARLAQRHAPAIDRAGWSMAVTRLEQAAENASWGSWDYEANQRADKEKNDALKALDALVAPFLAKEEQ